MRIEQRPEIDRLLGPVIDGLVQPERILIFGSYVLWPACSDNGKRSQRNPVLRPVAETEVLRLKTNGSSSSPFAFLGGQSMADKADFSSYLPGLRRMYEERAAAFERKRPDILERVRPAGDALRKLGAREVILFGSILRPNFFDGSSDIDILVIGLPDEHMWHALSAVEKATGINERDINPVFAEMVSESLVAEARQTGMPL
jgi:predicted nucleotidyltransferase